MLNDLLPENQFSLSFTPRALEKIEDLIAEEGNPNIKLRIAVQGGGCAGFQYGFSFDDVINDDDIQSKQNKTIVLIDALSIQYLMGSEIDYKEELKGSQFVINNPNATRTCGCGASFG